MNPDEIRNALRFYFVTDDGADDFPVLDQVRIAVDAGATMVQYRNKSFSLDTYAEVEAVCRLCQDCRVPVVVNDHVLLAKAVGADGVHVGQDDAQPRLVRQVMGPRAIVGVSVSTMAELEHTDLAFCDYIGTGPTFPTATKADAKAVHGLSGLRDIVNGPPCRQWPSAASTRSIPWIALPMVRPVWPSSAALPGPPTPSKPLRPWLRPAGSAPGGDGDGYPP